MKKALVCLMLKCAHPFLAGSGKKKTVVSSIAGDFETLSGKDRATWNYVQTKQDFEHLRIFKGMYDAGKEFLSESSEVVRIPKVMHFIWIGSRPFPRASVENVRGWMAKHPDWTVKFWTDRQRPTPCPGMQTFMIQDLDFLKLKKCFQSSDNYGEKSDILRYEILYREGGIYIDHDVKCIKAFDPMISAYDLFCGIDMPYTSSLPSCIFPTNNLIGVRAGHPVLLKCMEMLSDQWDQIALDYPGTDVDAMLNRVLHRTFWMFGESIKQVGNQGGNRDIVFPAYYFDAPEDSLAIWARHLYSGAWHESESPFEKMVRQRLMLLAKKSNKILLFLGVATGLNALGLGILFVLLVKHLSARS